MTLQQANRPQIFENRAIGLLKHQVKRLKMRFMKISFCFVWFRSSCRLYFSISFFAAALLNIWLLYSVFVATIKAHFMLTSAHIMTLLAM